MKDLSAFNVTHFPSGKQNIAVIDSISALTIVPGGSLYAQDIIESHNTINTPNVTDFTAALQLVYPANSVNPASKSPGGAEFYASPLNLSDAKNVTMEYSVYFPADFDWVKGGKLPGLYGGHTGCSGGAAAEDCFSTRLMWRQGGAGELYLYAPKRKQTKALCSDPQSVCDSEYGLSIGRGSFQYSRGNWTTLRQDVVLNTPGKQDGAFALFVNGMQAINRTDIFYRDAPQQKKKSKSKTKSSTSTFFGGHGDGWATPKQQYTWFKDFAITRNF
ncbi:polysaccharide lyase family 14 protein [Suillus subluteus]|nr:polysaccharide lyase family 14 protein [Suillus subluteus]